MPYIAVGSWQPDGPLLSQGNNNLSDVQNLIKRDGSLCAMPSLEPSASDATTYDGALFIASMFGLGTDSASVFMNATNFGHFTSHTNISIDQPHGFTNPKVIQGVPFGTRAIFTELSGGVAVLNLNTFITEDTPSEMPVGGVVGIIGNRLAIGRIVGSENVVQMSGIDNITQWDNVAGDTLTFPEGGRVQAVVGGDSGIVFCEEAVYRVNPVGGNLKHTKQTIARHIGLFGANAWYAYGRDIFFLSESGFKVINQDAGLTITDIGYGRVDKFMLREVAVNRRDEIFTYHDETRSQIVWLYPTNADPAGVKSSAISFNYLENEWGHFRFEERNGDPVQVRAVNSIRRPPLFSDDIPGDIEAQGATSFDDLAYAGGGRLIIAVDGEGKLRRFGERPVHAFGCTTKASDISALYDAGPPSDNRPPRTPPPTDKPPKLGELATINELLVHANLQHAQGDSSVVVHVIGQQTSDKVFTRRVEKTTNPDGKCKIKARARRFAIGFTAYNQLEECGIEGFIARFSGAGES